MSLSGDIVFFSRMDMAIWQRIPISKHDNMNSCLLILIEKNYISMYIEHSLISKTLVKRTDFDGTWLYIMINITNLFNVNSDLHLLKKTKGKIIPTTYSELNHNSFIS